MDPDGIKTIYTFANLEIKDVIKGTVSGSQIIIRKLGGTKDGVTLEIPSSVEFTEKEDGVFFLGDEQGDHSYEVSSLELGKFSLVEKNGEEILRGGIFTYSQPHQGDEHNVMADQIAENLKPWSIHQLKELVKTQQQSGAPTTEIQKNIEVSKAPTEIKPDQPISTSSAPSSSKQKDIISEEKENSPLYFSSTVWYSLATLILTLGVLGYLRRG